MEKLRIIPYRDLAAAPAGDPFTVSINPEKLTFARSVKFNEGDTPTTKRTVTQFQGFDTDTMSFELVIDGTGVASSTEKVADELKKLQDCLYEYDGQIHKPHYLKITWGQDSKFVCHLKSMNIQYTLFKSTGDPLRAKVTLTFLEYTDVKEAEAIYNSNSPDMTHVRTISEGDHLPQMCQEIYGDMKYYIPVARVNGLTNFRNLTVGTQLVFPPLKKA
ncbi:MAG: LysM peptidoglycan-binding domain-containing protein [Saprospirales bacterium]|nr:LysM peptidoglycan-binding domain-containing protein [Saprospirales bacterium]MBK6904947.1 LysM peptidoglycan-binding domain-containing protein [Saprospirales bacterium]